MPEAATVQKVTLAVRRNVPQVRCLACLSLNVGVLQKDAREAAQLLTQRRPTPLKN
jgi:hypothetical protein